MAMIVTPGQLNRRAELYDQLGSLLAAGVPIIKALETVAQNPPTRSFRRPVLQILESFNRQYTISEAFESLGDWMPAFDLALLRAGEKSGRLDACFRLLAGYYRDRAAMVRSVIADLLYPAFVFHFAVFVFPFIDWFRTGDTIAFAGRTLGVLVPIYTGIFLLAYACQGKRGETWRSIFETILHPIPVLGSARRSLALARTATSLEALINAGIPIIGGWDLAVSASGSPALARAVARWKQPLENGETPGELLAQTPEFPELFTSLYNSGEISGKLDDALRRLYTYYQEQGSHKLRLVARWAPRLVYFGVVGIVGFKIIMFYMNYFGQLNAIMQ